METAATALRDLIDHDFAGRAAISKDDLLRAARCAEVGEDALEVVRDVPDVPHSREGWHALIEDRVREREHAREAGMDAHAQPGWVPPSVRRHPNR